MTELINGESGELTLHTCPQCSCEFFKPNGVQRCPNCDYIWLHVVEPVSGVRGTITNSGDGSVTINVLSTPDDTL